MGWWSSSQETAREAVMDLFKGDNIEIVETGKCGTDYAVAWRYLPNEEQPQPNTNLTYVMVDRHEGSFYTKDVMVDTTNVLNLPKKMRKYITRESVRFYDAVMAEIELSNKVDTTIKTLRTNHDGVKTTYDGKVCFLKGDNSRKDCFLLYSRDGRHLGRVDKLFARELVTRSIKG